MRNWILACFALIIGIVPCFAMENLLQSGGFEDWSNWTLSGDLRYESWAAREGGTNGAAMYGWTTGGTASQDILAGGSSNYMFYAYGSRDTDFNLSSLTVTMSIRFFVDEAGTIALGGVTNVISAATSDWTLYSVSGIAPGATRCVRVNLGFSGTAGSGGAFKWDDAGLTADNTMAVRYVSPSGTAVPPYTNWATAANSIASALALSIASDTVLVSNGTYTLAGHLAIGAGITVQSVNGPAVTTIDAQQNGRCARMNPGSLLEGFTLKNGMVTSDVRNCYGGGVYCDAATLKNCIVVSNRVSTVDSNSYGGGVYACNASVIDDCTVEYNRASVGNVYGGGIYCEDACTVTNSRIHGNRTDASTIFMYYGSYTHGGGVYMNEGGAIVDSSVCNNQANGAYGYYGASAGYGAGIYARTNVLISGCSVNSNSATAGGGGRYGGGSPYGCGMYAGEETLVDRCVVNGNTGVGGPPGYSSGNCYGGGIYAKEADVFNSLVAGNVIRGGSMGTSGGEARGGGLYATYGSRLRNVTVVENQAIHGTNSSVAFQSWGGGVFLYNASSMQNCILYYNEADHGPNITTDGSGYYYTDCCIQNVPGGTGNITTEPRFADTVAGDYRLTYGSPCVDSGADLSGLFSVDLLGVSRPIDGNMDEIPAYDMGAFEYDPATMDSDADTILDADEVNVYGSNPLSADSDGDGSCDDREVFAGTSLTNAASVFAMEPAGCQDMTPAGNVVRWSSVAGKSYAVLRSISLMSEFTVIQTDITATPPANSYTDTTADNEAVYYYKVRVLP
jgi:predicted outer membrane repeat protein